MATRETLYLKLERNVETQKKEIHLSDLGKLVCADKEILARAKALKVCSFRNETKKRCVVSVMKILEGLQKIDPSLEVQNIGETEVIVERVEAEQKKGLDCSGVEFFSYEDGLCVQCMHLGPYDGEGETIRAMERYAEEQGYILDQSEHRRHHEIYLSDVRRCRPERLKTVIRQPVKR